MITLGNLEGKSESWRTINTVLYEYNVDAIENAFGGKISEIRDLEDKLNHALGYVDYTNTSIVKDMLKNAKEPEQSGYPVSLIFYDYNVEALTRGLESIGKSYENIDDETFNKMIAYALGYIDYDSVFFTD